VKRIELELKTWNQDTAVLDHDLEFSIGYDVYDESKHIIEVINNADDRMYAQKMKRRKERGQVGRA
jgi:GGDEF domain-containing protein